MKEEKKKPDDRSDDEKLHGANVLQTIREKREAAELEEEQKQAELLKKQEELERRSREEHERRLNEDKIELMRLKQGLIQESETIHEEKEEEIKLSFPKKISNFFYHNKWWLGLGVIGAITVVWFAVSMLSRPHPDMIVTIVGENYALGEESKVADYFASFADDFNGNGKVEVDIHYIPYTSDEQKNYANGIDTKLTTHMQSSESVILICGPDIPELMKTTDVFDDLSERYPDNVNVRKYAFMLSGTDFSARVGLGFEGLPDGWFMAVRTPKRLLYTTKDEMQKTYDRDLPVFDAVVKDLSGE
ncbi:MAG: hypothetical protein J5501_05800 [Ruminococcus sp.]|nr:hypothetical protein [Ruminococcus sp.]